MRIARITGGDTRQRRSFRLLTPVVFIGFSTTALLVAIDGFANQGVDEVGGGGLVMAAGAFCVRITRSRIHLRERSLVIVNPLFWYDIPYELIYRAEVSSGGSLAIRLKGDVDEDDEPFSTGFAGSLLDHYFKTTDRVVHEINKVRKNAPKGGEITQSRGFSVDPLADFQAACAVALLLSSLIM